jgi:RimJ/RimL family protein N-acetyltransferase
VIRAWRYPPPYDVYDDVVETDAPDMAPADHYAIVEAGELIGFCSFGPDARVPGGTYPDGPLDVGLGMRPDLIGRGLGARHIAAAIEFARRELGASSLRATVAEFNKRALRLCERAGFLRRSRFDGPNRAFWILTRDLAP